MITLTAISASNELGQAPAIGESFVKSSNYAKELIAAAKNQSQKIILDAEIQADEIRQRAFTQGYHQALQQAASSITAFVEKEKQQLFDSKQSILSLALRIAQDVCLTAVQLDRGSLLKRIERALGLLSVRQRLVVAVNPADIELVAAQQAALSSSANLTKLDVVSDPSIEIGAARLETGNATIQVDPLQHLNRYKQALLTKSSEV